MPSMNASGRATGQSPRATSPNWTAWPWPSPWPSCCLNLRPLDASLRGRGPGNVMPFTIHGPSLETKCLFIRPSSPALLHLLLLPLGHPTSNPVPSPLPPSGWRTPPSLGLEKLCEVMPKDRLHRFPALQRRDFILLAKPSNRGQTMHVPVSFVTPRGVPARPAAE